MGKRRTAVKSWYILKRTPDNVNSTNSVAYLGFNFRGDAKNKLIHST